MNDTMEAAAAQIFASMTKFKFLVPLTKSYSKSLASSKRLKRRYANNNSRRNGRK